MFFRVLTRWFTYWFFSTSGYLQSDCCIRRNNESHANNHSYTYCFWPNYSKSPFWNTEFCISYVEHLHILSDIVPHSTVKHLRWLDVTWWLNLDFRPLVGEQFQTLLDVIIWETVSRVENMILVFFGDGAALFSALTACWVAFCFTLFGDRAPSCRSDSVIGGAVSLSQALGS